MFNNVVRNAGDGKIRYPSDTYFLRRASLCLPTSGVRAAAVELLADGRVTEEEESAIT